jgi:tellurite resistance protein
MNDNNAALQRYLEALNRSYELLASAAARAAERSQSMGKRLLDDVSAGQREAADLAQRLNGKPEQAALAQAAIMAAALSAQARALSFSQLITDESTAASAESSDLLNQLAEASRQCMEAGAEIMRSWSTNNPFAEMAQQGMAAWTPRGQ